MMHSIERGLSEEQKMMRETCRAFVDDFVTPFIRQNWQREWVMTPEDRLPRSILEQAHKIGIRTLAIPEEFGGTAIDPKEEVRTFAVISEELARGDSGLADKLVQIWKVSVLLRNVAPRHLQERWFPRIAEDPVVPARALPHRAARRVRPLAAVRRAGGDDAHARRAQRRQVGDQRTQTVHQQRLRREALRRLCDDQARRGNDQRDFELSRAARHTRPRHAALQRDDGRAAS